MRSGLRQRCRVSAPLKRSSAPAHRERVPVGPGSGRRLHSSTAGDTWAALKLARYDGIEDDELPQCRYIATALEPTEPACLGPARGFATVIGVIIASSIEIAMPCLYTNCPRLPRRSSCRFAAVSGHSVDPGASDQPSVTIIATLAMLVPHNSIRYHEENGCRPL